MAKSATLTIANGETESAVLTLADLSVARGVQAPDALTFYAPGTLPDTVTLHTSPDGTNFSAHQSGGADIVFTAATATTVYPLKVHSLKLVADSGVAADRAFTVFGDSVE